MREYTDDVQADGFPSVYIDEINVKTHAELLANVWAIYRLGITYFAHVGYERADNEHP